MIESLLNNLSGYMADSSFAAYLAAYLGGLLAVSPPAFTRSCRS
jgi:hypothetical protein